MVITSAALADHLGGRPIDTRLHGNATTLALRQPFFHWPLEFPEVFAAGGFDVILSNPPWERIKLQEQEFFAARDPRIAAAENKAARSRLITELIQKNPALHAEFVAAVHAANCVSKFLRQSQRFPLTATGDINTYAVFTGAVANLTKKEGRAGIIISTGIATDDTMRGFFNESLSSKKLMSLIGFINSKKIFPAIKDYIKFALVTLGRSSEAEFMFSLMKATDIRDARRRFSLTKTDFELLNPNTKTCPIFRTRIDADLTRKIYERVPILHRENQADGNPWQISFSRMIDVTNDSHLFRSEPGDDFCRSMKGKWSKRLTIGLRA